MENFLMNVLGVAAIAAMLYWMWIMWRNVDRELGKIDRSEKSGVQKRLCPQGKPILRTKCIEKQFYPQNGHFLRITGIVGMFF